MPIVPDTITSIGRVTNFSTKSDENPGYSVWITTCVGENSGNTFNGLFLIWTIPYTTIMSASPIMTPAYFIENLIIDDT